MWIVFLGPPGAGKGTQTSRLCQYLNCPQLSTGEMLREAIQEGTSVGIMAAQYMDKGQLVPDPTVMKIVADRLDKPDTSAHGCLFDGFPRTTVQAKELDDLLTARGSKLDVAIELRGNEAELILRMLRRATQEGRMDDNLPTIERRMEVYRKQTQPLVNYYRQQGVLQVVDAMRPPDEVFEDIRRCVDELAGKVA